jgi:hypothetical protein
MNRFISSLIAVLLVFSFSMAYAASSLQLTSLRGENLEKARAMVQKKEPSIQPVLDALTKQADAALQKGPYTVMSKKYTPPSGDKHDYLSIGPYLWPVVSTSGVTTWAHKDGQANPGNRMGTDADAWGNFRNDVETLTLAWYLTGEDKYAQHAAKLIHTWYLDPKTKVNPNALYSQWLPGKATGTPVGTIDISPIGGLCNWLKIMESWQGWKAYYPDGTAGYKREIENWMNQYLQWLTQSASGKKASELKNNIGSWYDAQAASVALFVGNTNIAKQMVERGKEKIASQINPDGSQPLELKRTKAFSYSLYNLSALTQLAETGNCVGVDLWDYQTADGRSLKKAIDFLAAYRKPDTKWPYQEISPHGISYGGLANLLWITSKGLNNQEYAKQAQETVSARQYQTARFRLLYP